MIPLRSDIETLTDWTDLNTLLQADYTRPEVLNPTKLKNLTDAQLDRYDMARMRYVGSGMFITTPHFNTAVRIVVNTLQANVFMRQGRRSVVITGPSTTGKTSACIGAMRVVFDEFCRQYPDQAADAVPVAYVCIPANRSQKGLLQRLADYYHLKYTSRTPANELRRMVLATMKRCATVLVVIDELHNLGKITERSGPEIDTLKDLANEPIATFVYAGLGLEDSGLYGGVRGDQIGGRGPLVRTRLYNKNHPAEATTWRAIVEEFVTELPLAANDVEPVMENSEWLRHRCAGSIGTLHSILLQSFIALVQRHNPAQETLTMGLLERAVVDERARRANTNTKKFPFDTNDGSF